MENKDALQKMEESSIRWSKTPKAQETRKKYLDSDKGKLASKKYRDSLKGKEAQKRYYLSERGKAYRKQRQELLKSIRKIHKELEKNPNLKIEDIEIVISKGEK